MTLSDLIQRHTSIAPVLQPNPFVLMNAATYISGKLQFDTENPYSSSTTFPTSIPTSVGNQTIQKLIYVWLQPSKFGVHWRRIGSDTMEISLAVQTQGWFSFAIGELMVDADFMVAELDNTPGNPPIRMRSFIETSFNIYV